MIKHAVGKTPCSSYACTSWPERPERVPGVCWFDSRSVSLHIPNNHMYLHHFQIQYALWQFSIKLILCIIPSTPNVRHWVSNTDPRLTAYLGVERTAMNHISADKCAVKLTSSGSTLQPSHFLCRNVRRISRHNSFTHDRWLRSRSNENT